MTTPRGRLALHWIDPFAGQVADVAAASRIVAPMPGTVTRILAEPGADLPRGAPLIVLEAMKMEHTLRAPADGRLKALKCAVGDFVQEGTETRRFRSRRLRDSSREWGIHGEGWRSPHGHTRRYSSSAPGRPG